MRPDIAIGAESLDERSARLFGSGFGVGETGLVRDVDRGDPALGKLRLGCFEGGLEIVEPLVDGLDVRPGADDELDFHTPELLEVAKRCSIEGIKDRQRHRVAVLRHRAHCVAPRERRWKRRGDDVEV